MVQTQPSQLLEPSQLPKLALGLVELHPKAVDSGSPSIKVLTGTIYIRPQPGLWPALAVY